MLTRRRARQTRNSHGGTAVNREIPTPDAPSLPALRGWRSAVPRRYYWAAAARCDCDAAGGVCGGGREYCRRRRRNIGRGRARNIKAIYSGLLTARRIQRSGTTGTHRFPLAICHRCRHAIIIIVVVVAAAAAAAAQDRARARVILCFGGTFVTATPGAEGTARPTRYPFVTAVFGIAPRRPPRATAALNVFEPDAGVRVPSQ
ncbi:Hypothetical protein CINCED_3A009089 [Cinara cedri]|uniref:Uncharacterized protein n=1 Tax=Cinara cedri TaxID=506608 RepID=A0A5E4M0F5_9HEMI|nr:Hypothetical protein CINCED_3A009089 [Cinara cedri]